MFGTNVLGPVSGPLLGTRNAAADTDAQTPCTTRTRHRRRVACGAVVVGRLFPIPVVDAPQETGRRVILDEF